MFHPQIKRAIRGQQETLHVQERFVAGSLAGATAQTIIYPMEVRRTGLKEDPAWGVGGLLCCFIGYPALCIELAVTPDLGLKAISNLACLGISI